MSTPAGAQNLGDRTVYGLDVHGLARRRVGGATVRLWGFWSRILRADEDVPDGEEMPIGDLARHQIHVGAGITQGHWTGSLRARHVGERDTVVTNPIRTVSSHVTADLSRHPPRHRGHWAGPRVEAHQRLRRQGAAPWRARSGSRGGTGDVRRGRLLERIGRLLQLLAAPTGAGGLADTAVPVAGRPLSSVRRSGGRIDPPAALSSNSA